MAEIRWSDSDLSWIRDTEELVLVLAREGHDTIRVPVWPVVVDGEAYVRSYLGVTRMWFRRVQANFDQQVELDGSDVPVRFENVDRLDHVNKAIDAEFNRKYDTFEYRDSMSMPAAVEATLRLSPR